MQSPETAEEMLRIAADAAASKGGEDLVALNVSEPLPLVDIFLLVTGNSERNVAAIADEVEDKLLESGHKRVRREGRAESRWILLDFGDLIVHVFHQEERVYYGLERLWKDCPVVPLAGGAGGGGLSPPQPPARVLRAPLGGPRLVSGRHRRASLQHAALGPRLRGDRRQQRPRIGVRRVLVDVFCVTDLDHVAQVHHGDAVGDVAHQ